MIFKQSQVRRLKKQPQIRSGMETERSKGQKRVRSEGLAKKFDRFKESDYISSEYGPKAKGAVNYCRQSQQKNYVKEKHNMNNSYREPYREALCLVATQPDPAQCIQTQSAQHLNTNFTQNNNKDHTISNLQSNKDNENIYQMSQQKANQLNDLRFEAQKSIERSRLKIKKRSNSFALEKSPKNLEQRPLQSQRSDQLPKILITTTENSGVHKKDGSSTKSQQQQDYQTMKTKQAVDYEIFLKKESLLHPERSHKISIHQTKSESQNGTDKFKLLQDIDSQRVLSRQSRCSQQHQRSQKHIGQRTMKRDKKSQSQHQIVISFKTNNTSQGSLDKNQQSSSQALKSSLNHLSVRSISNLKVQPMKSTFFKANQFKFEDTPQSSTSSQMLLQQPNNKSNDLRSISKKYSQATDNQIKMSLLPSQIMEGSMKQYQSNKIQATVSQDLSHNQNNPIVNSSDFTPDNKQAIDVIKEDAKCKREQDDSGLKRLSKESDRAMIEKILMQIKGGAPSYTQYGLNEGRQQPESKKELTNFDEKQIHQIEIALQAYHKGLISESDSDFTEENNYQTKPSQLSPLQRLKMSPHPHESGESQDYQSHYNHSDLKQSELKKKQSSSQIKMVTFKPSDKTLSHKSSVNIESFLQRLMQQDYDEDEYWKHRPTVLKVIDKRISGNYLQLQFPSQDQQ